MNRVVLGGQWGDEGKGRIVDAVAKDARVVVRFQGGPNAGHTVIIGDKKYEFHQLPSGIMWSELQTITGPEVVYDIGLLLSKEFKVLTDSDIPFAPMAISPDVNIITNLAKAMDVRTNKIYNVGTTSRGIGPAYANTRFRSGITVGDLQKLSEEELVIKLKNQAALVGISEEEIKEDLGSETPGFEEEAKLLKKYLNELLSIKGVTVEETRTILQNNEGKILYEGAQGVLLDPLHGISPFVTSSPVVHGWRNTGYAPSDAKVTLVVKAYSTKVGNGPFPTKQDNELGERMRKIGREYGVTTGRPRDCGWLDIALLKYAVQVSGANSIAITKLDVLTGFEKIPVANETEELSKWDLFHRTPKYEEVEGWQEDITGCRTMEDLPEAARKYVEMIEKEVGIPVEFVSVGPEREQLIVR